MPTHPKNTLNFNEIRKKNKEVFGKEYTIQGRFFEDGIQYLIVKHNKCKRIKNLKASQYYFSLSKNQKGHCQFCNGGRPKTPTNQIEKLFYKLNNKNEWELLEETEPYIYPSNGLKQRQFNIKHKPCGTIRARPTNHICKHPIGCMECKLKLMQENKRRK